MVQVDVFWGYGFGASLAAAAGRPLARLARPFESRYFVGAVLFLSLLWAPTGMLLLLRHPSWETMQAATSVSALSEWLVLGFGISNITQGILGFVVGRRLLAAGRDHEAHLNWIFGYFGMFFILLYGWDGLGYDRFLYDRDMLPGSPAWVPGIGTRGGVGAAFLRFFGTSVARTLYLDGVYLLPMFFVLTSRWTREAFVAEGATPPSALQVTLRYLGLVFGVGFGAAAFSALAVRGVAAALGIHDHVARTQWGAAPSTVAHITSYVIGLPLSLALLWFVALRPGRLFGRLLAPLVAAAPPRSSVRPPSP